MQTIQNDANYTKWCKLYKMMQTIQNDANFTKWYIVYTITYHRLPTFIFILTYECIIFYQQVATSSYRQSILKLLTLSRNRKPWSVSWRKIYAMLMPCQPCSVEKERESSLYPRHQRWWRRPWKMHLLQVRVSLKSIVTIYTYMAVVTWTFTLISLTRSHSQQS